MKRRWISSLAPLGVVLACLSALCVGQFGGKGKDTVLYLLTTKGAQTFETVSVGSDNAPDLLDRVDRVDPAMVPSIPLGPPFPDNFTHQPLHSEPDDFLTLLTHREGPPGPHRVFLETYKTFVIQGFVREVGSNTDGFAASYAPLGEGVDYGPDKALEKLIVLFWASNSDFPLVQQIPPGETGPKVPPGMTGTEYVFSQGKVIPFLPWHPLRRLYPGSRWPSGIFLKTVDVDPEEGSTLTLLRFEPGTRTPPIRISGNTHVFVLEGRIRIEPAGSGPIRLETDQYVFIPGGLRFRIINPKEFDFSDLK